MEANESKDQTFVPKTLTIGFTVNELNYLQEQISASQNEGKIFCNKNALSYALIDSTQAQSLGISEVIAIFGWNQPGVYYGKSYCKIYIENECYQAEIPDYLIQKISKEEVYEGCLSFTHLGDSSNYKNGWMKYWLDKFSSLKSLI